jgi:sugar lactone lactonase YvrE
LNVVSGISDESRSSGTTGGAETTTAGVTSGGSILCTVPASDPTTTVTTLAGNGVQGFFDGSGGRDGTTQFHFPTGVVTDALGNLYVADYLNFRIRKVDQDGNTATLAGNGIAALQDGTGGPDGTAAFAFPFALTIDHASNILVADVQDNRVRQVDSSGNVTTLPCTGTEGMPFNDLSGIALGRSGQILVADGFNNRICKFGLRDGLATILAGGSQGNLNGTGTAAQFNHPTGVAVDASGSVYIGDTLNNVIRKIDSAGNVTTFAGDGDAGFADGPSGSAQFAEPAGLSFDPVGNLIVADSYGDRIRRIDPVGNVTTIAGNGQAGDTDGTGGASGTAEFNYPDGVAVDSACNVYVAGNVDNRIRKVTFGVRQP